MRKLSFLVTHRAHSLEASASELAFSEFSDNIKYTVKALGPERLICVIGQISLIRIVF